MKALMTLAEPRRSVFLRGTRTPGGPRIPKWTASARPLAWLVAASLAQLLALAQTIVVTVSSGPHGHLEPEGVLGLPSDSELTVRAYPEPGYEVGIWYVNRVSTWEGLLEQHFAFGDDDVDIHVDFQRITHGVYVETRGSGQVSPTGTLGRLEVASGEAVTFTATPDPGHHVEGWWVDDDLVQTGGRDFTLAGVQAEHSVKVTFAIDVFTVEASAGPGGSLTPSGNVQVRYGEDQTFRATPDEGAQLDRWWLDDQPVLAQEQTFRLAGVASNHVLRVSFRLPAPRLSIVATPPGTLLLSWPKTASGWILEHTQEITGVPGLPWPPVREPYRTNASTLSVSYPFSPGSEKVFFRLREP